MSAAAALLDRLGRPGDVRLGAGRAETIARLPTGIPALDAAVGGGLPRGRVSELAGPRSAGRTGLACAVAAHATRAGETVAWVDVEDALEPEAAAVSGVVLARLLWVRPLRPADAFRAAELLLGAGGFGLVVLDVGDRADGAVSPRLAHVAERTGSALLVVAPRRRQGSPAALVLEVSGRRARWSAGSGQLTLFDGLEAEVRIARTRVGRPGEAVLLRQACA